MNSNVSGTPAYGLNLLIYPSAILSSGRLGKIAQSLQSSGLFSETHVVGIGSEKTSSTEPLGQDIKISRIPGAKLRGFIGGVRIMLFWPLRVYREYRKANLSAVAAQNVYLLPLAYHLARKTNSVFAYNAHELETETIGAKGIKKRIAKFLEQRYIYRADVISVVNKSIADWYSATYPGIFPVILSNIPTSNDERSVDLRSQLDIPDGQLLYIHVGFLMEGRSIPLILEAFAANPDAHIAFLGDGYLRPQVIAATVQFPNIHLLDTVAPESVVATVRGADVGICLIEHVSLSDELSTPNKLMEALAAGIPPLSSDLVEARQILGPELSRTWILSSPREELQLALERITVSDIKEFQDSWHGIPSWDSQATILVEAYRKAITATSG